MEIRNPGGIYGRLRIDQLGKMQPDTRNPVLASALEVLGITENRYSGIPTIRREMEKYHLREPVFLDERGNFAVIFYKNTTKNTYSILTGAEFKKTTSGVTLVYRAYGSTNSSTGMTTIEMALVYGTTASESDTAYAYLLADPVAVKDADKNTVYELTIWTAGG